MLNSEFLSMRLHYLYGVTPVRAPFVLIVNDGAAPTHKERVQARGVLVVSRIHLAAARKQFGAVRYWKARARRILRALERLS